MPHPVFISYARQANRTHAQALAAKLGDLAFLDTTALDDGDHFPHHLLDGILDASIVVIFATEAYTQSRFCRLEMRLALAGGDAEASHLVLALGEQSGAVLEAMPTTVAGHKAGPQRTPPTACKRWCIAFCKTARRRFATDSPRTKPKSCRRPSSKNPSCHRRARSKASSTRCLPVWPNKASEPASSAARISCATSIGFSRRVPAPGPNCPAASPRGRRFQQDPPRHR